MKSFLKLSTLAALLALIVCAGGAVLAACDDPVPTNCVQPKPPCPPDCALSGPTVTPAPLQEFEATPEQGGQRWKGWLRATSMDFLGDLLVWASLLGRL